MLKEKDFNIESSLYMNSPYIADIEREVNSRLNSFSSNLVRNNLWNKEVSTYLLRKLGPLCPLWSSFCHNRETNTIVESHNKVIKADIIRTLNIKPSQAIKELRASTLAQLKIERCNPLYKLKNKKILPRLMILKKTLKGDHYLKYQNMYRLRRMN